MTGEQTAQLCAKYADDKKAENIVILDVRGLSPITDYFVICTASSAPHLRAVQVEIDDLMHKHHGQAPYWRDDNFESQWLILDYSDVMVHIFQAEKREFYSLEELWGDGKAVALDLAGSNAVALQAEADYHARQAALNPDATPVAEEEQAFEIVEASEDEDLLEEEEIAA